MPIAGGKKESRIGEGLRSLDSIEGEADKPMNTVKDPSGQDTLQDLVGAQIDGGYASMSGADPQHGSSSSNKASPPPEIPSREPCQTIKVVKFDANYIDPSIVKRQMVDVTPGTHRDEKHLKRIPDFGEDWDEEGWKTERKVKLFYVGPKDFPKCSQLHGYYWIFYLHSPGYEKNTHIIFRGNGRHIHEDFFIAKRGQKLDCNGAYSYVDMPEEFLSARTEEGKRKVYEIDLEGPGTSIIKMLLM